MDATQSIHLSPAISSNKIQGDDIQAKLTLASAPLTFKHTSIKQLTDFIAAAMDTYHYSQEAKLNISPLDILFWVRLRLIKEMKKPERDEIYKASCLKEVHKLEQKIASACVTHSNGHLTLIE